MDRNIKTLINYALAQGALVAEPINTEQIVFDPRSHLKCRFGCNRWGKFWTCPPHLNLTQEQFLEAFKKYQTAIFIRTADPEKGQKVALAVEKEAMLSYNYQFAFAMVLCVQCDSCSYPESCRYPHLARPAMDAYGVDIGQTVQQLGLQVEFDKNGKLLPAWYSLVLLK